MKKNSRLFSALTLAAYLSTPALALGGEGNPILDPTAIDSSVNPCQDFYQYSCGKWIERTTLPSDQSEWARSFSVVYDQNLVVLHKVLNNYSQGTIDPPTPYAGKLGDYYASCMDQSGVEAQTPVALMVRLSVIDSIKDKKELPALLADLTLNGINGLFSMTATTDLKDPTLQIAEVDQGGMTLPGSTYYTKTDSDSQALVQTYKSHIAKMLVLGAGESETQAAADAQQILELELSLAKNALAPEDLQDPVKLYHPGSLADLQAQTPDFDCSAYFAALGIDSPKSVNVSEAKFMAAVNALIKSSELSQIKTLLKFHTIEGLGSVLGKSINDEWFAFEETTLNGVQVPSERWKKCVRSVSNGMSEALGQAFVAQTFTPQAKARAIALIANLRKAFSQDLSTLGWLDEQTRKAALAKLDLMTQKIGYPDQWRNYDSLAISRGSYWQNALNASAFETRRVLQKIGGKTDPSEWGMSPQTVNAYYDPGVNQINFPAAILQPPFFSDQANDASNYGAIGMVIGHEMTHGFDTSGSQFDGHGAQVDWWSPSVKAQFDTKAQCLINQYSTYNALPNLNVNGKLTITENIADQGGLKLAFAAYQLARQGQPEEAPIAGLTGNQQFFVSMAQLWCDKQTDASLKQQVMGDPHSPAKFRVIGTIVNSPDFAKAFGCQAGAEMAPVNRCSIW